MIAAADGVIPIEAALAVLLNVLQACIKTRSKCLKASNTALNVVLGAFL